MYHTMIVDDEPLMRTYLTQSIPAFSTLFDVSAAAKDGLEAVELLKKIPVDVVITDIKCRKWTACPLPGTSTKTTPT